MQTYVVLFRGINVAGNNLIKMKALTELLEQQGFEQVKSYIQSGNLVLKSAEPPADKIKALVSEHFGFTPEVFALNENGFIGIAQNNPFQPPAVECEGKFVHFFICPNAVEVNSESLSKYQAPSEQVAAVGNTLYLFAPDGIGRSKLVKNIERCINQPTTARNLNTINKLLTLIN